MPIVESAGCPIVQTWITVARWLYRSAARNLLSVIADPSFVLMS